MNKQAVEIEYEDIKLNGHISMQPHVRSWIIFAHGSGSSHKSPRNNWVASELNRMGHGILLFDLLTPEEDLEYANRFNLPLLAERLEVATKWLLDSSYYRGEPFAYFGASTGAGAALITASRIENPLFLTVISRGGRPDLAGEDALRKVFVPVLLIVGSLDLDVITLNQEARDYLPNAKIKLVQGATHLFEEEGKLAEVVRLCANWLDELLNEESAHP